MFYTFRQNNSGGSFEIDPDKGISVVVIIEAPNDTVASRLAEDKGIYFNGVDAGQDCECCGDRWHRPWDEGYEVPSVYGTPIDEYYGKKDPEDLTRRMKWSGDKPDCFVHYLDGRVEAYDYN